MKEFDFVTIVWYSNIKIGVYMDYKKIRQEIISFFILFFVSLVILIISSLYIKTGIFDDVIYYSVGGAVFAFISFYAMINFVERLKKVSLARKVGDVILYDGMRSIKAVADKMKKTPEKVEKALLFLINNNYIKNFKLDGDRIINLTEERNRKERIEDQLHNLKDNVTEIARDYASSLIKKKRKRSARCSSCGAVVVFTGHEAICPYCSNMIKSD